MPIQPARLFVIGRATSDHAKHLILEIGFYNEDLPHTIRDILEIGERLNCMRLDYNEYLTDLFMRYFKGVWISDELFHGLSNFEELTYKEGNEEIVIPYTWQRFSGEQVLRMQVDGVHIPYEEAIWAIDEPPQSETESAGVRVAITGLYVNDTKLELSWKITNDRDHDVWICDNFVERFLDTDNKTLSIRMRYNLSNEEVSWESPPPRFRYSRLRPGQEKVKSLSFAVPVEPSVLFKASLGNAESAKRLAVEIGFYDEDLSALIIDVVRIAERLRCDASAVPPWEPDSALELYYRFFGGVEISRLFNSESFAYFHDSVIADGDEIIAPYLFQTLDGERTLRIEVDNVSIPYRSNYPPLESKGSGK